ncbi:hypothetical protein ACFORG_07235 [Lutimaribacter marinistellae]|uniref:Lipopolysaccharide export system protein LptC n=1 Tax=Lutimaribacter marinistellae TaxID=1820329 RepID=A0ABV7TE45_9RHOB
MDGYSRLIQFLKVLLPLAALMLLSSLFLLSRDVDPEAALPFAERDLSERVTGQQITRPFFSGTSARGEEILITAETAKPGSMNAPAAAEQLFARMKLVNGREITVSSDAGDFALDSDTATFAGDVRITTSDGFVMTTDTLETSLSGIEGAAPRQVDATGPIGHLVAGAMQFGAENEEAPVHILFTNGVKLVYDPQTSER